MPASRRFRLVLEIGVAALVVALAAYGVSAGLAQNVAASGGSVVVAAPYAAAPYAGWGWGWGWPGFGIFGPDTPRSTPP